MVYNLRSAVLLCEDVSRGIGGGGVGGVSLERGNSESMHH